MRHIASWTQESNSDETLSFLKKLALAHAREGGEQGKLIADYISGDNLSALCDFSLDYETLSAWNAINCRQALGLFTKSRYLDFGLDKKNAAIVKFKEAELACLATNDFISQMQHGSLSIEPWLARVFHTAQRKIAMVLGDVPRLQDLKLRFGPGATTLTKKSAASAVEKLQAGFSCSEDLLPFASQLIEEMPHLADLHGTGDYTRLCDKELCTRVPVRITHGVVDFVPKNAKTHRSIIKEGSLNTMIQLAIGDHMTRRLALHGINLKDQTPNQRLARQGSIDGSYATLDLSSASDTVAKQLVFMLLPYDWAFLLDISRSSTVLLEGTPVKLEKFSSMGNGFTFPLETLIFWALTSSCSATDFASVYGDDIVVRTEDVALCTRVLEASGFSLNREKSFWTGPFRESCGVDYLRGIDIRPYYQKNLISPRELFGLHNFYWRHGSFDYADLVRDHINEGLLLYGPDGFGDGHLVRDDWKPRQHKRCLTHGYGGVLFDTFKLLGRRDKRALRPGDRVLPLYSIYIRENSDEVLPETDAPEETWAYACYLRRYKKFSGTYANEPIPERVSPVDGKFYKVPSLPGTEGYKRVSIYTLCP